MWECIQIRDLEFRIMIGIQSLAVNVVETLKNDNIE
jgi:hypothetical protein